MNESNGLITKRGEAKSQLKKLLMSGQFQSGGRFPTEVELVRQLGYSRGTVREAIGMLVNEGYLSRVRGSGTFVAPEKRPRVTIAVVIDGLYDPEDGTCSSLSVEVPLLDAVRAEARKSGAGLLLYSSEMNREMERDNLLDLIDRQVDGAIVLPVDGESNLDCLEKIRDSGIPLVQVDRYIEKLDADYVVTDNFRGAYDAVSAMVNMGIENTYYVSLTDNATSTRDRMLGYTEAVHTLGVACNIILANSPADSRYEEPGTDIYANRLRCVKKSLENMILPTAIFSAGIGLNAMVCTVLQDLEIPPEQLVLGYFDHRVTDVRPVACYFEVEQPLAEIGAKCVRIIMDRIKGGAEKCQLAMKPRVTIHNASRFVGAQAGQEVLR